MFTLSGFADEVSDDFVQQMDIFEAEGIKHIELRGILGKNVADLTMDEAKHCVELADFFGAPFIRLFSYFIPEGEDPAGYRDEVMRRMKAKAEAAEGSPVVLLHENERHIYGETGPRCKDILDTVNAPNLKGIVDPANYVICGEDPYDCWDSMKEETVYFHVKDATKAGEIQPAGLGDGRFPDIFKELVARNFDGFASLEPHLSKAHASRGETAPDLFKWASDSLKKVIDEVGGEWK